MLTIGNAISRLNHLEYPAFEKMNQNGRTTRINHKISPKGPIDMGMSLVIFCMKFLLRIVCFSHLTFGSRVASTDDLTFDKP